MAKTTPSSLHSSVSPRAGGRKIDTWSLQASLPDQAGKRVEVAFEVSLLPSMEFVVNTTDIAPERWQPLQGKVLAELREQAEEAARQEIDLRLELEWSTWLEVRVEQAGAMDQQRLGQGATARAHLAYRTIPRAQTPDGQAYTLAERSQVLVRFPTNVQVLPEGTQTRNIQEEDPEAMARMSETQRLRFRLGNMDQRPVYAQFTYLPDTPENRAGLDAIIQGIDTVNLRLQQFLHPDEIQRTLARATQTGMGLLVGPTPSQRPKGP